MVLAACAEAAHGGNGVFHELTYESLPPWPRADTAHGEVTVLPGIFEADVKVRKLAAPSWFSKLSR